MRIGAAATKWARGVGSWRPTGMCQQFTRSAFGVGAYYGTASKAWANAKHKHPTRNTSSIPAGVPVFWTGGSRGFGHAAVSIGGGLCRSTDWPRAGSVGTARISDIERVWGHRLVGWTEDINRVRVYAPKPKAAEGSKNVRLSNLRKGEKNADVADLQRHLRRQEGLPKLNPAGVTGFYGDETVAMVRAFQRSQGWKGADADGKMGPHTARLLGLRVVR